ncbi:MAG: glycosyltransferase family 4 protein [Fibrobacteria bacterium]
MRIPRNRLSAIPAASPLKILMRNRSDTFTRPGGDTVLLEGLREGLRALGHTVDVDTGSALDARHYDIVHLFNLTLPDWIAPHARDAAGKGVPFVIHALQEDWPRFLNRALATAVVLEKYVAAGQPRARLESSLALLKECPAAAMPLCADAAKAAAILCTGREEAATVLRDYPSARTRIVPLAAGSSPERDGKGIDEGLQGGNAEEDFRKVFGLDEFILCVGRLEPRKNQLMLLAALEESEVTVVFADGGFSYAPEYAEACRKFSRRGRTVFTGRLASPLLRSAYRSAKVSCLPSWYELPGLATLESALWGRQVVTTDYGTIRDYLGESCLYAEPDDVRGLAEKISEAWDRDSGPGDAGLHARAAAFRWERTVAATEAAYREALSRRALAGG